MARDAIRRTQTPRSPVKDPERKVDHRLVLKVYQRLMETGEPDNGGRTLHGLHACADHDGYTVSVSDGTVTVRALFHNKLAIEAPSGRALEAFVRRLERLGM